MPEKFNIIHYRENGKDFFEDYVCSIRDKTGRLAIDRAVSKLQNGNFGVHKPCREGVWELIIDTGPGYRVYYSIVGRTITLLLCAGNKRTQQKDINRAKEEHNR